MAVEITFLRHIERKIRKERIRNRKRLKSHALKVTEENSMDTC
jgi:hypothetical protein